MDEGILFVGMIFALIIFVFVVPLVVISDSEDGRYEQCITAKMQWVDGNCINK